MKTPEVRIYFSWLLYESESAHLNKFLGDGKPLRPKETYEEWTEEYRAEWATYAGKILHGLTDAIGAEFYQPVIDVPCAPWFRPKSLPLIMDLRWHPSEFVDVLAHELTHLLLADNTIYSSKSGKRKLVQVDRWRALFGGHNFTTMVHIPVHALSEYLYRDVLQDPARLDRDLERCKGNEAYEQAWAYVQEHGYKEIIAQLKGDYVAIEKELKAR